MDRYIYCYTASYLAERGSTKQVKVLIQLPATLKAQLDTLRSQGYTINGYIRSLLERELKKGR